MDGFTDRLQQLESDIIRDFDYLNYPAENWVKAAKGPTGEPVLDVAIIGGGMCGMAAAVGLRREGVLNFRIFERQDKGFEGPWVTTARMETLRSPKHLTGPHMGLPNLTFQAWYQAKWGWESWQALGNIPREMWMEYLRWYRKILDIPTENNVELLGIEPAGDLLKLYFRQGNTEFQQLTRRIVLATGRAAFGGTRLPAAFAGLPKSVRAHTEDDIDFTALKGKKVIVIGGAASAVDSAATALEAGADEVNLLLRAAEMPRLNKFKSTVYSGFLQGFFSADDETRWRFLQHGFGCKVAAPRGSMLRLKALKKAHIHFGSPAQEATVQDNKVVVTTPKGSLSADFLILGTGYAINIGDQPEFSSFADKVKLWQDQYSPPEEIADPELGRFPYLGGNFELLEKKPGEAPYLSRIHLFNAATTMSHAALSSDIPGVNVGANRLTAALVRSFFVEDSQKHLEDFYAYNDPELLGDEWTNED
ncbi:NAD(P)/FAD-dependent oxidoreductase [Sneathiella marina]|uniref:NAD(P)/FAD-dependent oxidoreductase n=1 Tax=Sneathiella marina TaxID=2950108 RepID=A0ABY4W062_9PROT|nr:NAD(P)/FAD-dependent oxidoreductase [Sneathiella marina]USG60337.1 NAD(P)/FAD-dependent oxidoreductase [Sneathiella marina]